MEKFSIDLAHILENRDFTVLQELESYFCNFRKKVAAKIEEVTAYEIGTFTKYIVKKVVLNINQKHLFICN